VDLDRLRLSVRGHPLIVSDRIVIGDAVGEWVERRGGGHWRPGTKCIGVRDSRGNITAGVLYDYCNGASVCVSIAVERMSREFLRVIFDYPFNQLKTNVLIAWVAEVNAKSRRLVEHIGFVLNSRIANGDPTGDLLIYTMNRSQCRYLGGSNGKT